MHAHSHVTVLVHAVWATEDRRAILREEFDEALAAATVDAARLLGISDRVGSLEPGKDGDVALYDGDPFEYTSHVVGVVIQGEVVSRELR